MTSIVKQYMEANNLSQYAIARAAGLTNSSIQRQVEADFDSITMRTVQLLANVQEKPVTKVFDELYSLNGGTNTWSSEAGIYRQLGQDDTFGLQEALKRLNNTDTAITIDGGDDPDVVSITKDARGFSWTFAEGSSANFKQMWREIMVQSFPQAVEQ